MPSKIVRPPSFHTTSTLKRQPLYRPWRRKGAIRTSGEDLLAATQTIREIGDREALDEAVDDATGIRVVGTSSGRFEDSRLIPSLEVEGCSSIVLEKHPGRHPRPR